jgi:hypothetical protein
MAVTNEDILERFELNRAGVVCFRAVEVDGIPRWAAPAAAAINKKAGEPVTFWPHVNGGTVTKLYGQNVFETRIRKILGGRPAATRAAKRREPAEAQAAPAQPPVVAPVAAPADGMTERQRYYAAEYAKQARPKAIKTEMGFAPTPTGGWRHEDGRVWVDLFFQTEEGLAAAAKVDGNGGRD